MNRKLPQYSIRMLLLVTCICAGVTAVVSREPMPHPPSPCWRENNQYLKDSEPLKNVPTVFLVKKLSEDFSTNNDPCTVAVTNNGETTLIFWRLQGPRTTGTDTDLISQYIEQFYMDINGNKWHSRSSPLLDQVLNDNGNTFGKVEISPNETVEMTVWFNRPHTRLRVLTLFSEKDTKRKGLVVLATMPKDTK